MLGDGVVLLAMDGPAVSVFNPSFSAAKAAEVTGYLDALNESDRPGLKLRPRRRSSSGVNRQRSLNAPAPRFTQA